ncbi:hypothetical protein LJC08_02080 [Methanimicrococcus sp. OttesenSCG-928-J09]|nr:hypothetical protein [Methanimicrococcus sp. OttesenSCG-928-J09]
MRKSENVMNSCDSSYLVLSLDSFIETRLNDAYHHELCTSKSVFWEMFKAEICSQLSHFKSMDRDLEDYILSGKFIDFERKHYCRNYFILSSEPIENTKCKICEFDFENCNKCCTFKLKTDRHKVLGYFSIAGKSTNLINSPESQKKLSRLVKFSSHRLEFVETYLVGHLSKNFHDGYDAELSGDSIFPRIFALIEKANKIIGINVIRVDCSDNKNLIKFYERHGFRILPLRSKSGKKDMKGSKKLITMVRQVH